jgi:hypothetical protein
VVTHNDLGQLASMQNKFVCIAPERLRRSIKLCRRRQRVANPRVSHDLAVVFVASSRQAEAENPLGLIENSKVSDSAQTDS